MIIENPTYQTWTTRINPILYLFIKKINIGDNVTYSNYDKEGTIYTGTISAITEKGVNIITPFGVYFINGIISNMLKSNF